MCVSYTRLGVPYTHGCVTNTRVSVSNTGVGVSNTRVCVSETGATFQVRVLTRDKMQFESRIQEAEESRASHTRVCVSNTRMGVSYTRRVCLARVWMFLALVCMCVSNTRVCQVRVLTRDKMQFESL